MNYTTHVLSICLFSSVWTYPSQQSTSTQAPQEKETKEQKVIASKVLLSEKEALEKYEKEFLNKYQPTDRKCGPGITYESIITKHKFGDEGSLDDDDDPAGFLSCLIAGKRQVALIEFPKLLDKQLLKLLKHKQIHLKPILWHSPRTFLAFTPQGLENATHLERGLDREIDSGYFKGYLLGYPEEDILAWYMNVFIKDREEAFEWIAEQEKANVSKAIEASEKSVVLQQASKMTVQTEKKESPTSTSQLLSKEALERYEKELLERYNPTPERCRPQIRLGDRSDSIKVPTKDSLLWINFPEEPLACLLSGNKHIVELALTKPLNQTLQQLLHARQIKVMANPTNPTNVIAFSPQGERNASLWLKTKTDAESIKGFSRHLDLHLLEYSGADILADYLDDFYTNKAKTHNWIEKKSSEINQIMLNALRLPFMSSVQPSEGPQKS